MLMVCAGILNKSNTEQGTQGFPQIYPLPWTRAEQIEGLFQVWGILFNVTENLKSAFGTAGAQYANACLGSY